MIESLDSDSGHFFKPVKSLKFAPEATWTGYGDPTTASTTVLETYRPATTTMPSVTLGDADHLKPTLDLSTQTTTLDGTVLSFYEGALVTVDTGERKIAAAGRKLVSGSEPPVDVSFKHVGAKKGGLVKCEDGLYYKAGLVVCVR